MIAIDDDVFGYNDLHGACNENFVVTGDFARPVVLQALAKAAARFVTIDQEGREHPSMEAAAEVDAFTPSYVSDPEITARGVEVYVDASGGMDISMGQGLRRVLREELERVGVDARVFNGG